MGSVTAPQVPPPPRLFELLESGVISRQQLQAAMSYHQRLLLVEIAEARRNPVRSYLEERLNRFAAARLERRHGERLVRQVLVALGRMEGFPLANLLWNASHRDVPLHCFFRTRREPVFRILRLQREALMVSVVLEHGRAPKRHTTREEVRLRRDRHGGLVAAGRAKGPARDGFGSG